MSDKNLICSFCGLSKTQTNLLVAGQEAHICVLLNQTQI
jgi:hypothetical protein